MHTGLSDIRDIVAHYSEQWRSNMTAEEKADLFEVFMEEIGSGFIDACSICGGDTGYVERLTDQFEAAGKQAMADVRHALEATPAPRLIPASQGTYQTHSGSVA